MSTGEKRIFELTETQTFGNGDYLPLDNLANSETKKIEAKKLGITYTMTDTEDGFSFDGSNGYHYEKVIPKDAQMSYDDYEDLTEAEKMDGSNRFIPDYPEEEKQPEIWTRVGRDPLNTDQKTISKAINELDSRTKAVNGDAFDETVTYSKGDYSIYDNKMYVYTSDTPSSGSWDSTKWTQTDIQTEFAEIKSNLTDKLNGSYELIYSGSATATASNKTLSDGKKFSDYKWLLMALDTGGGAARISASNTIPMQIFIDGMLVYASYTSAQVNIKYVSDTQFTLAADGNRVIRIYGIN